MRMTPIGNTTYDARVLWTQDVRATYPLVALSKPGITLAAWRRTVASHAGKLPRKALIGIYNTAGCAIAILEWNGGAFGMFAGAPALMFDPGTAYAVAARAIDGMMSSGTTA